MGPNLYTFHICGVELSYNNTGLSIILGQRGEQLDTIQIPARIAELHVWVYEDDEYFQIKGLELNFVSGAMSTVGARNGPKKKSFRNFVSIELM